MDSCMTHRITFLAMAKAAAVCNCALRFAFYWVVSFKMSASLA